MRGNAPIKRPGSRLFPAWRRWGAAALLSGITFCPGLTGRAQPQSIRTEAPRSFVSRWLDPATPDAPGNAYVAAALARETIPQAVAGGRAESEAAFQARLTREFAAADLSAPAFPSPGARRVPTPDTQCFVTSTPDLVLVAFRGTEAKWQDVLTDASCRPAPFSRELGGQVHTGFRDAYRSIAPEIKRAVEAVRRKPDGTPRTVCLIGHSMGGALAQLAALDLRLEDARRGTAGRVQVYAFGSPKVGDRRFCAEFDARIPDCRRFVFADDIVPRLPPAVSRYIPFFTERLPLVAERFPDFTHPGRLTAFSADYRVLNHAADREVWEYGGALGPWLLQSFRPDFDARRWYRELFSRLARPCADHSMGNYLQASYHRARTAGLSLPDPDRFAPWYPASP